MNTNWFLAILVEKKIIEKDIASELAKELEYTTYSHSFDAALEDIQKLLKQIQDK